MAHVILSQLALYSRLAEIHDPGGRDRSTFNYVTLQITYFPSVIRYWKKTALVRVVGTVACRNNEDHAAGCG